MLSVRWRVLGLVLVLALGLAARAGGGSGRFRRTVVSGVVTSASTGVPIPFAQCGGLPRGELHRRSRPPISRAGTPSRCRRTRTRSRWLRRAGPAIGVGSRCPSRPDAHTELPAGRPRRASGCTASSTRRRARISTRLPMPSSSTSAATSPRSTRTTASPTASDISPPYSDQAALPLLQLQERRALLHRR